MCWLKTSCRLVGAHGFRATLTIGPPSLDPMRIVVLNCQIFLKGTNSSGPFGLKCEFPLSGGLTICVSFQPLSRTQLCAFGGLHLFFPSRFLFWHSCSTLLVCYRGGSTKTASTPSAPSAPSASPGLVGWQGRRHVGIDAARGEAEAGKPRPNGPWRGKTGRGQRVCMDVLPKQLRTMVIGANPSSSQIYSSPRLEARRKP